MEHRNKSLTTYMAVLVKQMEADGRIGTAHVYHNALKRILDFTGGRPLPFGELTPGWLKAFQNYLLGRQLQWNSISTYMRMLRAVYFRAVDAGIVSYHPRLFKGVYTGTRVTVKRAVDERFLHRLGTDPVRGRRMEETRQLFLLLFMLRGIPFVDIAYLRHSDLRGNILSYRRHKTGTWITVRIEPPAMHLLESLRSRNGNSPYLFPFINKSGAEGYRQYQNALRGFNARLKRLALQFGVKEHLSSYTARHSWATIANFRNYSQELISNAMGHSSVRVTETYFKSHTDERIGQMNRDILTSLFGKQWNEQQAYTENNRPLLCR